MRRLLIDQGNSRIKAAWDGPEGIDYLGTAEKVDELVSIIKDQPSSIWLSSVAAGKQQQQLLDAIESYWGVPATRVRIADYQAHLSTAYRPDQLGVDRWLAMLAGVPGDNLSALVVDAGTAITVDTVVRGRHEGGYILPGLTLAREALLSGTAIDLPGEDRVGSCEALATETGAAISQGMPLAVVALVERLFAGIRDPQPVIIGGGDAHRLAACLQVPHVIVENLVLKGLSRLALLEEG